MIENKANFLFTCRNTLERMIAGNYHGRETRAGVMAAIRFVKSLDHDCMSEKELKHAIRLTMYRGQVIPSYQG